MRTLKTGSNLIPLKQKQLDKIKPSLAAGDEGIEPPTAVLDPVARERRGGDHSILRAHSDSNGELRFWRPMFCH